MAGRQGGREGANGGPSEWQEAPLQDCVFANSILVREWRTGRGQAGNKGTA